MTKKVNSQQNAEISDSEKLDEILNRIAKIEQVVNPPLWKLWGRRICAKIVHFLVMAAIFWAISYILIQKIMTEIHEIPTILKEIFGASAAKISPDKFVEPMKKVLEIPSGLLNSIFEKVGG